MHQKEKKSDASLIIIIKSNQTVQIAENPVVNCDGQITKINTNFETSCTDTTLHHYIFSHPHNPTSFSSIFGKLT